MKFFSKYPEPFQESLESSFADLVHTLEQKENGSCPDIIFQAMSFSAEAHEGQLRKDGTPYISHPIEVARILCDINMPSILIVTGLLHDVIEDCTDKGFTKEKIETKFGKEIRLLTESVTKVTLAQKDMVSVQEKREYETYQMMQKLIISLADDSRAIIIKLADRLHNMRTLEYVSEEQKLRKSVETLEVYSPLASILGFSTIKSELDDISFRYKHPKEYHEIKEKLIKLTQKNTTAISEVEKLIEQNLHKIGLTDFIIKSRTKSAYGIFKKMKNEKLSFEHIYDTFGMRIIYTCDPKDETSWAWKIFGEIASVYPQKEDRIRNFILQPKNMSGYQSLHLTIIHPVVKAIEIQIRSQRMHINAEQGGANHTDYKAQRYGDVSKNFMVREKNPQIQALYEALIGGDASAIEVSREFYQGNRMNIVYTQSDECKNIADGASVLDFAFKLHTDLLMNFDHALINGEKVLATYILRPYDKISIIKNAKPTITALSLRNAQLSSTRSEIRKFLRKERDQIIQFGREKLRRFLRAIIKRKLGDKDTILSLNEKQITNKMIHYFGLSKRRPGLSNTHTPEGNLHYRIAKNSIDRQQIIDFVDHVFQSKSIFKHLKDLLPTQKKRERTTFHPVNTVLFGSTHEIKNYQMAHCCRPLVGDGIKAVEVFENDYMVHKHHCEKHPKNKVLQAHWESSENPNFFIEVKLISHNKKDTLKGILEPIYSKTPEILEYRNAIMDGNPQLIESYVSFICPSISVLTSTIQKLEKLSATKYVYITSKNE